MLSVKTMPSPLDNLLREYEIAKGKLTQIAAIRTRWAYGRATAGEAMSDIAHVIDYQPPKPVLPEDTE